MNIQIITILYTDAYEYIYIYIYMYVSTYNPPACRRVLWILLVRSCTVCLVLVSVQTFPLARIFAPSNLNPPPPPPPTASHLSFQPSFRNMVQFQLKPRLTQNPCFVSPLRVFPLRLSLQCAGFDFAHDVSIVVLTIGWLCHSYTFYVPMPHTRGLSIHLLLCRTQFTHATSLCMAFFKNLGSHTASV